MSNFPVYVDVSTLSGPLQLSVLSATGNSKRFKIRICQYESSCMNSNNCLQYYTGVTGTISSFNYDQAIMLNRSVPGYFVITIFYIKKETLFLTYLFVE